MMLNMLIIICLREYIQCAFDACQMLNIVVEFITRDFEYICN